MLISICGGVCNNTLCVVCQLAFGSQSCVFPRARLRKRKDAREQYLEIREKSKVRKGQEIEREKVRKERGWNAMRNHGILAAGIRVLAPRGKRPNLRSVSYLISICFQLCGMSWISHTHSYPQTHRYKSFSVCVAQTAGKGYKNDKEWNPT